MNDINNFTLSTMISFLNTYFDKSHLICLAILQKSPILQLSPFLTLKFYYSFSE